MACKVVKFEELPLNLDPKFGSSTLTLKSYKLYYEFLQ